MSSIPGLPSVPDSALPPSVRAGSQQQRDTYRAALGFERMLVGELIETMTASTPLVEGPHGAAVEGALADSLLVGGGLGLAAQLHSQLPGGSA